MGILTTVINQIKNVFVRNKTDRDVKATIIKAEESITAEFKYLILSNGHVDTWNLYNKARIKIIQNRDRVTYALITTGYFKYLEGYREYKLGRDTLVALLKNSRVWREQWENINSIIAKVYAAKIADEIKQSINPTR